MRKFGDCKLCLTRSEKDCGIVGKRMKRGDATVHMRGAERPGEATNHACGMCPQPKFAHPDGKSGVKEALFNKSAQEGKL
jgi:hypothetical protein